MDGQFLITTDTGRLYADFIEDNEIVRKQVGGDQNPQWENILAKPFENLSADFVTSEEGVLSVSNTLKYTNRTQLQKISEINNIPTFNSQPLFTICGRVETLNELNAIENPTPGMVYYVGTDDADVCEKYIYINSGLDEPRWENFNGDLSWINERFLDTQTIIGNLFSEASNYGVGDYVIYDNILYKCIETHPAGPWLGTDFILTNILYEISGITVDGTTINEKINATQRMVANNFSSSTSYSAGDYVIYENVLYKCLTTHSGSWNSEHFSSVSITNELDDLDNFNYGIIADSFDSTKSYAVGDYILYENSLYKCLTAHSGAWSANDFTETQIVDEFGQGSGGNVDYTIIAAEFNTTQNYNIGDYVIYQNDLYKCTTAHTAGSWNSSNFEKTDVMTALKYNTVYTPTAAEISASITNIWG